MVLLAKKPAVRSIVFEHKNGIFVLEQRQVASGSVKVAFLQFTAQAFKMQTPQNQIINF